LSAAAGGALQLTSTSAALAAAAAAGGSTAATTAAAEAAGEMWVDKHVPRSVADLVVHKKKVAEVQDWLAFYTAHRAHHHTRALLVTGTDKAEGDSMLVSASVSTEGMRGGSCM
jgi:cell cycle checkpoint protein